LKSGCYEQRRKTMKDASGAAEGIRTPDPRITNALLYRLSYRGFAGLL
jgi:hypothetical protein